MSVSRKRLTIVETFFQEEITLELELKTGLKPTLLEALNANKVSINQSCGGYGTCGTCRVEILEGHQSLDGVSEYEQQQAQELQLLPGQRLSCQTELLCQGSLLKIKIINEVIEDV